MGRAPADGIAVALVQGAGHLLAGQGVQIELEAGVAPLDVQVQAGHVAVVHARPVEREPRVDAVPLVALAGRLAVAGRGRRAVRVERVPPPPPPPAPAPANAGAYAVVARAGVRARSGRRARVWAEGVAAVLRGGRGGAALRLRADAPLVPVAVVFGARTAGQDGPGWRGR